MNNGECKAEPITGRILKGIGGKYSVLIDNDKIVLASPRGKLRKTKISPYPGDNVDLLFSGDPDAPYCIDLIHPRNNFLLRPSIANIDLMILTCSVVDPLPDYYFIEKMIILCVKANVDFALCITKSDVNPAAALVLRCVYENAGFTVFLIGKGYEYDLEISRLKKEINGKTIAFAGQSGVGKSTLFNKIAGHALMGIGLVSEKSRMGKHTTRHSEIIKYDDGFIADTPGFSTLELEEAGVNGSDVLKAYPDINKYDEFCKFRGCRHITDKGCAVDVKDISSGRLERYREFRQKADSVDNYILRNKSNGGKVNDN